MVIIGVDAGHGRGTAGKRFLKSLDSKETREWVVNDRIVRYVIEGMKEYEGYKIVRLDDPSGATDIPLGTRVRKANNSNLDILVSYHHDAGIYGGTGGGLSVHRAKGSSTKTAQYQKALYDELIKTTGLKGNRYQPLAINNFYIVARTNAPAVLVEHGFMDSRTDVPIILSDKFARQAAQGHINFFVNTFNLKKKNGGSTSEEVEYYSKNHNSNHPYVTEIQKALKKLGYDVIVRGGFGRGLEKNVKDFQKDNGLEMDGLVGKRTMDKIAELLEKESGNEDEGIFFRVVAGSYRGREKAEEMRKLLQEKGIDSFLTTYKK